MIKLQKYFGTKTSSQTFIILIMGILLLQITALFVFAMYWNVVQRHARSLHFTNEFVRTVVLAKTLPMDQLQSYLKTINRPGFSVKIKSRPDPKAQQLLLFNPSSLQQMAAEARQSADFRISVPLNQNQWLNMHRYSEQHLWTLISFIFVLLVLLAVIILLCAWAVKRLTVPLGQFAYAAEEFGRDVNSASLAETGSEEIKTLVRAFNAMQARIRRLYHDRTQMLAAITHDLRTPLTRLQLRAEYLQGTMHYEKILSDIKEMEQMITSILFFSRDYARIEKMERFDINALISSLCDDMNDAGYQVNYQEHPDRIVFCGHLISFKRAITNLIENAVKYGQFAKVVIARVNQQLRIKIEDNGPGIPIEEMEKVFEPFYRIDASRSPQTSGTGLGLAVSRDVIRAHGGEIELQNRIPNGLIVLITLPIEK